MTHQQKRSVEFHVPYLWDGVLCMCDLFMKIKQKKQRFSIFETLVLETILGIIQGRKCVLRTNKKLNTGCKTRDK